MSAAAPPETSDRREWRHALAAEVVSDASALCARLTAFAHPQVARVIEARVAGAIVTTVERAAAGSPLEGPEVLTFTDKVLALGTELAPALQALASAGLAHGRIDRDHVVRGDAGLVLVGASGLRADGTLAGGDDDARALLALLATLLPSKAPEVVRARLAALVAAPPPVSALASALLALRSAVPVPPGRQVRSIKRLAFPPPVHAPRRSKRHLVRVILIAAVVGLGLMALLSSGPEVAWPDRADAGAADATPRADAGPVVIIHTTPLPGPRSPTTGPAKTNGTP